MLSRGYTWQIHVPLYTRYMATPDQYRRYTVHLTDSSRSYLYVPNPITGLVEDTFHGSSVYSTCMYQTVPVPQMDQYNWLMDTLNLNLAYYFVCLMCPSCSRLPVHCNQIEGNANIYMCINVYPVFQYTNATTFYFQKKNTVSLERIINVSPFLWYKYTVSSHILESAYL